MRQVNARERRYRNLEPISFRCLIRDREQHGGRARSRFPLSFHRGNFGRLVVQRVEPVQVAEENLYRHEDRNEGDRHRQHALRLGDLPAVLHMPRRHSQHGERRGQVKPGDGVHQAERKRRIEDDREPACRQKAAIDQLVTSRGMHPAVERQDPERREQRAKRHHHRRKEMRPRRNELAAEQQDAEETGFEKERHHAFVGKQRSEDVRGDFGIAAPVGAELERHHDARYDAHAE